MMHEDPASPWLVAPVLEAVARTAPDRPAVVHGEHTTTWGDLGRAAGALAADLLAAGLSRQAKVATLLFNDPALLITYAAALRFGFVPLSCNYRYGPDEVTHLLDDADAEAVVFHTSLLPTVEAARRSLPSVRRWYAVADDGSPIPRWATPWADLDAEAPVSVEPPSGDDLLLLYTGGTTGRPKGVMWTIDDLVQVLGRGGNRLLDLSPARTPAELLERAQHGPPGPRVLVACPLMHGTGQFTALATFLMGGTVVLLADRKLDVAALWTTVAEQQVESIVVVGQAFGAPMLEHLRQVGGDLDLSRLRLITSSGVMWSQENKAGLLEVLPHVTLLDNYGSSEAVGVGSSVSTGRDAGRTAEFRLGRNSAVFTEDGRRVEPGSGERGLIAITGPLPVGYYKDEERSASTFRVFEGRRWSVPGDWAEIEADGTVRLLGRGSSCINTGGEKVFPEEVEEVLKGHPEVVDAAVVGVPDDRFGAVVTALVELEPGGAVSTEQLQEWVRARLASFKVPRRVAVVESVDRQPNGKLDHPRLAARAAALATAGPG